MTYIDMAWGSPPPDIHPPHHPPLYPRTPRVISVMHYIVLLMGSLNHSCHLSPLDRRGCEIPCPMESNAFFRSLGQRVGVGAPPTPGRSWPCTRTWICPDPFFEGVAIGPETQPYLVKPSFSFHLLALIGEEGDSTRRTREPGHVGVGCLFQFSKQGHLTHVLIGLFLAPPRGVLGWVGLGELGGLIS